MADKYTCFKDLAAADKRGDDYDFELRSNHDSIVIAIHGGTIEPETDQIAAEIAGKHFSFYWIRAASPARWVGIDHRVP